MFRLVRISITSFLHGKNEQRLNEGIADASLKDIPQIVMWRLQFCFQKKEFLKNSSLVIRNAVSRYALGVYSADSPYATRHPTRHQNPCILLIIWVLYA